MWCSSQGIIFRFSYFIINTNLYYIKIIVKKQSEVKKKTGELEKLIPKYM